jgi:hypothetical protein
VTRFAKGTLANQGINPETGEPRLLFTINNATDTSAFRTTPLGGWERSGAGVEPTEPWVTRPHWF